MNPERAAIALLFVFNLANAFLLWRITQGCRAMAGCVRRLSEAQVDHARTVADLAALAEKDMRARAGKAKP